MRDVEIRSSVLAVALTAMVAASPASASLIFDSSILLSAQGFGNAPRALTIQAHGDATTETGCISVSGGGLAGGASSCILDTQVHDNNGVQNTGDNEVSPLSDNQKFGIPTLSSLDITNPNQIGILFNATEPGGDDTNVTDLTLKFYNGDTLVAAIDGQQDFPNSMQGNGVAGFAFVVDPAEQSFLDNTVFNQPGFGTFHMAIEATITNVGGGPESFAIVNITAPSRIPEPSSLVLLVAGGLIALGFIRGPKIERRRSPSAG